MNANPTGGLKEFLRPSRAWLDGRLPRTTSTDMVAASSITLALAYLAGSLPTGFLVARAMRVDITRAGSGNIGATNVFRVLGRGPMD